MTTLRWTMMLGSVALVAVACRKADAPGSQQQEREAPRVVPVGSVGVLPEMSLANGSDEDTAAEIAEVAGDDPTAPRCKGVRLELKTKKDAQGRTAFVATIINDGSQPVTLVEPGDGSDVGWRTPVINWKVTTPDGKVVGPEKRGRCGNVNSIQEKEIFTMKPRQRHVLSEWLGEPNAPPGHYVVRLVYDNDPGHQMSGMSLGANDPKAIDRIRKSTPCKVESGPVTVDLTAF